MKIKVSTKIVNVKPMIIKTTSVYTCIEYFGRYADSVYILSFSSTV